VLVLLPPSETKVSGGDAGPLDLGLLSFGELNPLRDKVIGELTTLAADVPASLRALGLTERQEHEVARNRELPSSPTLPALARYTGVLFDALDIGSMTTAQLRNAQRRLAIASALFGLVRGSDPVPAYRLSAASTLPGIGSLRRFWRPRLEPVLAGVDELVVDLRSGPYAQLARAEGAVVIKVVTENAAGVRTAISHHNKAYKGRLARTLAVSRKEPESVADLLRIAERARFDLRRTGTHTLDLVIDP
jgi:hypothetical protein